MFQEIATPALREVEKFTHTTQRDIGWLGSTGIDFKYVRQNIIIK